MFSKGVRAQIWYTILATATFLSAGINISWSSAALPHLISGDVGFSITSSEASWVVSLYSFGTLLASFYAKFAVDIWGRKITIMSAALMYLSAWAFLVLGNNVWYLYVGRILAGLGFGTTTTAGVMYVGEIAHKSIRGGLNTMTKFMINFGQLLAYIVGAFTFYSTSNYIYAIITIVSFAFGAIFLPESPYYYIKQGKLEEAKKVFMKLRAETDMKNIQEEMNHIEKLVEADMKNKTSVWELFTNRIYRKSLVVSLAIKLFQHGSGFFVISSYIQTILDLTGMEMSAKISSIIYGAMQLFVVMIAAFVVDMFGRKKILFLSFIGIAIAQSVNGAYFYIQNQMVISEDIISQFNWVPLLCLILFCFSYNIGIGPITYVLDGELFPTNVKAAALATGNVFSNIVAIVIVKLFQILSDSWGIAIPFWIFSGIMVSAIFFTILVIPETKGRSFDVIQKKLNNTKFFKI